MHVHAQMQAHAKLALHTCNVETRSTPPNVKQICSPDNIHQ